MSNVERDLEEFFGKVITQLQDVAKIADDYKKSDGKINPVDAFIKNQRNKVWEETTDATRRTAYDEEILKWKSDAMKMRKERDALKQEVRRLQERLETIQKVAHDAL